MQGLKRAKEAIKLIYSPPLPTHHSDKHHKQDKAPLRKEEMQLDPNHGAQPGIHMIPRDDLKGIRAEGTGREVLLQAGLLKYFYQTRMVHINQIAKRI